MDIDTATEPETFEPCVPSSEALKAHVSAFMARADAIVEHRLAAQEPDVWISYPDGPNSPPVIRVEIDFDLGDTEGFDHIALQMRPIVYIDGGPLNYKNFISQITHEHRQYGTGLKRGRREFIWWSKTSLSQHHELGTDLECADLYLNGFTWHADSDKILKYESSTPAQQAYYSACAKIHTLTAISFIRKLRNSILEMRSQGCDL